MSNLPQIIDAVAMIRMVVSHDYPIHNGRVGRKKLLAQVGSAIDQQPFASTFD
jgi:hypothetical protein